MGTYFNISVVVHGGDQLATVAAMREANDYCRRTVGEDGISQDAVKWYDFDAFFQKFSAERPELILDVEIVSSEGPEWHNVYQDGTVETFVCEKSYPGLEEYLEFCGSRAKEGLVGEGVKGGD